MGQAHTPGPWVVGGSNSRMILRDIPGMCDGHDGYSVAVTTSHSLLSESEALANARLIAAAPDLLKACEAAEEWLSGWASAEPYLTTIRAALSSARATGGTE